MNLDIACITLLINEYIKTGQTDTTKVLFINDVKSYGTYNWSNAKTYMHLFPTRWNSWFIR